MKKWAIRLFSVLFVVAGVAYFHPPFQTYLTQLLGPILPTQITHDKLYRWQDAQGQWQLSDKPPADGIQYEIGDYHKQTNVIPTEQLTGKKKE